jgi:hypothetical protein
MSHAAFEKIGEARAEISLKQARTVRSMICFKLQEPE